MINNDVQRNVVGKTNSGAIQSIHQYVQLFLQLITLHNAGAFKRDGHWDSFAERGGRSHDKCRDGIPHL
jgi:hypothetical protein